MVDSIEGVTHALRTAEYADRNTQYHWFLSALHLQPIQPGTLPASTPSGPSSPSAELAQLVDTGTVTGVTEVLCDGNLAGVEAGSIVQLGRKG